MLTEDRWISVEEVAAYFGVKRDTIYKWINRRNMPAHKVGRLWKFRKEEVDEWVKSGSAKPACAGVPHADRESDGDEGR